jgi:hypothetical protein
MFDPILQAIRSSGDDRRIAVEVFHHTHLTSMLEAAGSSGNHQCWKGGYYDHLAECFAISEVMWNSFRHVGFSLPFTYPSVLYVLYFHDIEKMWKYGQKLPPESIPEKSYFYEQVLPTQHAITFTSDELNALKYIHGEGDDYRKDSRIMGPLTAFCHSVDVLSARIWYDSGKGSYRKSPY